MKAFYIEAPNKITQKEINIASLQSDEVLVKVFFVGLCGSDTHLYKGSYGGPAGYPLLFGHEWSGMVEKVGENVTTLKRGDKVTGDCSRFCGDCENCQIDKNLCSRIEKFGITIDGASSEFIVRKEKHLYKAPEDIALELLCLAEPVSVAFHLIDKIISRTGGLERKNILILGAGSIGIAALMLLKRRFRCRNVSQFDIAKNRTVLAQKLGARILSPEDLIDGDHLSSYQALYTAPKFDVVIESSGAPDAFTASINMVKPMGTVGCIGMIPEVRLNLKMVVTKALVIMGSIGGTGNFADSIDFINQNSQYVRQIISHQFTIDNTRKAFEISRKTDDSLKVLLAFR